MNSQNVKAKEGIPKIRACRLGDREQVLLIARDLVQAADTYAFDADVCDEALWSYWNPTHGGRGFVAELGDEIGGIFVIKRNQPGPGAHIANGSYAVRNDMRGRGIGGLMGRASLELARELGFRAMQFNIVLADNQAAIRAWLSLGFKIIGTIPEGFQRPEGSYVDFHIMHLKL